MTEEPLWTAEEAAAELGINRQTIYTWTSRGHLTPAEKRGRLNLYRLADVVKAEASRKRKHRKRA